jgi:hypothetical protein
MAFVNGTNSADTLYGTSGIDSINGLGGNDERAAILVQKPGASSLSASSPSFPGLRAAEPRSIRATVAPTACVTAITLAHEPE